MAGHETLPKYTAVPTSTFSLGEVVARGCKSAPPILGIRPAAAREVSFSHDEETEDTAGDFEAEQEDDPSSSSTAECVRWHPRGVAFAAVVLIVMVMLLVSAIWNSSKGASNAANLVSFFKSSQQSCGGFSCPKDMRLKSTAASLFCMRSYCTNDDTGICCEDVACPANSQGVHLRSGCMCSAGFKLSSISAGEEAWCMEAPCPAGSSGTSIPTGCTCPGGVGQIVAVASSPYYAATCPNLPCPKWSSGVNVGKGCHCLPGFNGSIELSRASPFFSGKCDAGFLFVVKDRGEPNCLTAKAQKNSSSYSVEYVACDYSVDQQWYWDESLRLRWGVNAMCLAKASISDVTLSACQEGVGQHWHFDTERDALKLMPEDSCLGYTNLSRQFSNNVFLFSCEKKTHPWALHMVAGTGQQSAGWSWSTLLNEQK